MEFLSEAFSVKLLSVLHLDWKKNDVYVPPRPYSALSFRIKGNAVFSDSQQTLSTRDGDILFMPAGAGYHLTSGPETLIVIHFEFTGIKPNKFEVISPADSEVFSNLFSNICTLWQEKKPGYYLRCSSLLYRLLELLLQPDETYRNSSYEKLRPAIRYLHEHFCDSQLTVETLCNLLHISDTYFRKLFCQVYGTTPNKYLNALRISHAEELLGTGYYTIEEVADRCGFSDGKYFSTVFKKLRGYPPSAYLFDPPAAAQSI